MTKKTPLLFSGLFLALALCLWGCGGNAVSLPPESAGALPAESSAPIEPSASESLPESALEEAPENSGEASAPIEPSASESAPGPAPEEAPEGSKEASAPMEPSVPESAPGPASEEAPENPGETAKEAKDRYQTVPVPESKPEPVEPQETSVDETAALSCTFSIRCDAILDNLDRFEPDKLSVLPADGVIFAETTLDFYEGESAFDVLLRVTKDNKIHMEFNMTPMYNSASIEGINNIYEFDCGDLSGWMFKVNGWFPNYGCSRYQLSDGDVVEWVYTCDLGRDVGQEVDGSAG